MILALALSVQGAVGLEPSRRESGFAEMNTHSLAIGLSAASLLAAPIVAVSPAFATMAPGGPEASTAQGPVAVTATSIRFLDFDHSRKFGGVVRIRGQVAVPSLHGALAGVRVKLYRQYNGTSAWRYLAADVTSRTATPQFRFRTAARGNADYRVVFGGNSKAGRSRNATSVLVHRRITAKLEDRTGRFHGRVSPGYSNRVVSLDKRSCASCGWRHVRSDRAGSRGGFSFDVNAPRKGRYFWRVSVPATRLFTRSYSGVFTTKLS